MFVVLLLCACLCWQLIWYYVLFCDLIWFIWWFVGFACFFLFVWLFALLYLLVFVLLDCGFDGVVFTGVLLRIFVLLFGFVIFDLDFVGVSLLGFWIRYFRYFKLWCLNWNWFVFSSLTVGLSFTLCVWCFACLDLGFVLYLLYSCFWVVLLCLIVDWLFSGLFSCFGLIDCVVYVYFSECVVFVGYYNFVVLPPCDIIACVNWYSL